MGSVVEFRGVDNLVFAEVVQDDLDGYETGPVKHLSAVAEISKTTEVSSTVKYYDNAPAIVIGGEGADEITITCAIPDLQTYAEIIGKDIDSETGAMIDSERVTKYFALGYRFKKTDGTYRYVWRLKGTFSIPDESSKTEDDGTDSTNIELTYTGIATTYVFAKNNKKSKGLVVDDTLNSKADISKFFDAVTTPDMLKVKNTGNIETSKTIVGKAKVGESNVE